MVIPDNYSQWEQREAEAEAWLAKRPVCSYCDNPIQDDKAYNINGELVCEECLRLHFEVDVEDYIDG